jgi:hypothetical protein
MFNMMSFKYCKKANQTTKNQENILESCSISEVKLHAASATHD